MSAAADGYWQTAGASKGDGENNICIITNIRNNQRASRSIGSPTGYGIFVVSTNGGYKVAFESTFELDEIRWAEIEGRFRCKLFVGLAEDWSGGESKSSSARKPSFPSRSLRDFHSINGKL